MNKICSQKEVKEILERERDRSDRTNKEFSIVIFEATISKNYRFFLLDLCSVLIRRIRCYDYIGWIDKKRIVVIMPDTSHRGAQKLADDFYKMAPCDRSLINSFIYTYPLNWINIEAISQTMSHKKVPALSAAQPPDSSSTYEKLLPLLPACMPLWKKTFDFLVSLFLLIFLSPVLIAIGLYIKIVSPGPVLFKQKRIGYMGNTFYCFKFRTMNLNADTNVHMNHFKNLIHSNTSMNKLDKEDMRIIPFGLFLRKSGLDELPQLINVLKGQMSLIGPRPCIPYEAREYIVWQRQRFNSMPGLTGLWQVNGKNRTTFNDMIRFDITYARKLSFLLDIKILLKTLPAIISQVIEGNKNERTKNARIA